MFRTLQEISAYHSQGRNVDILENNPSIGKGLVTRTCNVTSLSMALEGLGKSANDFTGNRDTVLKVAEAFKGPLSKAELKGGVDTKTAGDWGQMAALRLPDFMELVAIAHVVGSNKADAATIHDAATKAWDMILYDGFLQKLATEFGATCEIKYFSFDGKQTHTVTNKRGKQVEQSGTLEAERLGDQPHAQRSAMDKLIDARNQAEALQGGDPKKYAAAQKHYEELKAASETALSGKAMEKSIPIEGYKKAVQEQLGGELASGAAIETHVVQHFVRVHSIEDDHVVIDDPAQPGRAHKKVLWEEARAQGMFDKRLVMR